MMALAPVLGLLLGLAAAGVLPQAALDADLEEHLGATVDRALAFTDMGGHRVTIGDSLDGARPLLLILAYYRCPTLCGLVLRGAAEAMSELGLTLGADYHALTVSFDPRDTPAAASAKRASALIAVQRPPSTPHEWPFLVGDEPETHALASELGFRVAYDPVTDQYAHPAAIFVLTPEGRISRYLYGVRFAPLDLRLALVEAGRGRIGTLADRALITCYRYDPASRRYGPSITAFLRLGGIGIITVVVGLLGALFHGERRRRRTARRDLS